MPGKKDHITIDPGILSPHVTTSQVMKQYGAYTASPAKKPMSVIIEVKIDKSLQFQVNRLNEIQVSRRGLKIHLKILNFAFLL